MLQFINMDKASKTLVLFFILLIVISVATLYYKSFVTESYEQTFSEDYDLEEEDGEATEGTGGEGIWKMDDTEIAE